jgi:histidinol phosphatase-like PHP family hydrolase/predicted nuclease with RNAse H fold/dephospho-CoA kinase
MIATPPRERTTMLRTDYFRMRDFEYAQPLYDLAFLLEVQALSAGQEVPKYRVFSLWKAAYRMDGYTTLMDRWLDGKLPDKALDHVPSSRIRQYLEEIRATGTLSELALVEPAKAQEILRLRSMRGVGASRIAEHLRKAESDPLLGAPQPLREGGLDVGPENGNGFHRTATHDKWQAAHIVPPLLRFLHQIEIGSGTDYRWLIQGIKNGVTPVISGFTVHIRSEGGTPFITDFVGSSVTAQPLFSLVESESARWHLRHQQGWAFWLNASANAAPSRGWKRIVQLAKRLDPLIRHRSQFIRSDLHLHTSWSDGNSDISGMAAALKKAGREYFAITDHSRSCKLQGGLTPVVWLRQAASLLTQNLPCRALHGIEVDILATGSLDLPSGLLRGMDLVIGSVHGNWSANTEENTLRLLRAIESGLIDILGHPTSALVGKPGVPNYRREPAAVDWPRIFRHCAQWRVALELNCFPSRLDLALPALREAIVAGCWISLGSDAHARGHLQHLHFGERIVSRLHRASILNHFTFDELRTWLTEARRLRAQLPKTDGELLMVDLPTLNRSQLRIAATLNPTQSLPAGSRIVGIDLTAGRGKASGVALLDGYKVETKSLVTDDEIIEFIETTRPKLVSIDSPLGFPGGGAEINPTAGIVRMAERDLASVGISAYPALIDSMRDLTVRGIALKRRIEASPNAPTVIESYPGAAQDILSIPRKQVSLSLLRHGLRELGLHGPGLGTSSHDEMDAITSAIVGRYFEAGEYEPMGVPAEAQLIVPKLQPLRFDPLLVICLAGRSGTGKSVVGRYLALFYGFRWIRTRDVIRALLIDDIDAPSTRKMFHRSVSKDAITEQDLRDFGVVVLEQYQQRPLKAKLMQIIKQSAAPVVVDSVRDIVDVDTNDLPNRLVRLWYLDTSDSRLLERLKDRQRVTGKAAATVNPIDQKADILRQNADVLLRNSGTLEELRWRIDDSIFTCVELLRSR